MTLARDAVEADGMCEWPPDEGCCTGRHVWSLVVGPISERRALGDLGKEVARNASTRKALSLVTAEA